MKRSLFLSTFNSNEIHQGLKLGPLEFHRGKIFFFQTFSSIKTKVAKSKSMEKMGKNFHFSSINEDRVWRGKGESLEEERNL